MVPDHWRSHQRLWYGAWHVGVGECLRDLTRRPQSFDLPLNTACSEDDFTHQPAHHVIAQYAVVNSCLRGSIES
jgi:hypothetical protein